ncbi:MAG: Protein of unknown function (DUF3106) [Candidatus Electronema aureum]|uniref:Uncharacterized protein n=1 Tax=Candidatus Electronema aureum TaxID=2005002 RepID=A0A521G0H1_9BACT|nr:MAG: Protein of unknown function (DUF3106) [Candidatus Electronema aureum]
MGKMKTLFGMTAAVLLTMSLLFVSLPETASARKVTVADMVKIRKAAAKKRQSAKMQAMQRAVTRYKKMTARERKVFQRFVVVYGKMNAREREAIRRAIAAYNQMKYQNFCSVERVNECYPVASPNSPACVSMCRQISTETCLSSGRSKVTQIATGLICSK